MKPLTISGALRVALVASLLLPVFSAATAESSKSGTIGLAGAAIFTQAGFFTATRFISGASRLL